VRSPGVPTFARSFRFVSFPPSPPATTHMLLPCRSPSARGHALVARSSASIGREPHTSFTSRHPYRILFIFSFHFFFPKNKAERSFSPHRTGGTAEQRRRRKRQGTRRGNTARGAGGSRGCQDFVAQIYYYHRRLGRVRSHRGRDATRGGCELASVLGGRAGTFAVNTPSDDSQYVPCNQSDTPREWRP
jgi:hypothetical protein